MHTCPVCNSEDTFLFMKGIFDSEDTEVIECNLCGVQFLFPMMSDNEEEEYYRNYYEGQKIRHYRDFTLSDLQQNALKQYEKYFNNYYDLIKDADSILEIGSGTGGFLNFINKYAANKKIVSVERSESNLEFLKDTRLNDFSNVTILDNLNKLGNQTKFDAIIVFNVLEHVKEPVPFLNSLSPFLKNENSLMAFTIPNTKNPLVNVYGLESFRKFIYMLQHCYTFSEKSLVILAGKAGLKVKAINYLQVWGLDNHLSWLRYNKPKDFSFYTNLLSKETMDNYDSDLIANKTTDAIMAVFQKSKK
jgi:cyclopropane fatty-acyl-phospholipid synthase-like methyltransferase